MKLETQPEIKNGEADGRDMIPGGGVFKTNIESLSEPPLEIFNGAILK